jgi:flagellar protein FlaG
MEIQQTSAVGPAPQALPAPRDTSTAAIPAAAAPAVAPAKPKDPQQDQITKAVEEMQKTVGAIATDLRFSVDKDSGRLIVSVIDSKTHQVVRQIPSEDIMKMARNIDRMQGLLFSGKA